MNPARRIAIGLALPALALASALGLAAGLALAARAGEPLKLRASLDTSATHGRTVAVADYLKQVEAASGGRIHTELFHSGQLYRDRDVAKALRQGGIEMAVPGIWVLSGFVPDTDIFQLPAMFGQPADAVHRLIDGKVGQEIDAELERKLDAKVLGTWLDLGFQNTYSTTKPLDSFADFAGLKMRNSGGAGQYARARFFGAIPNMTAWPDVPLALSQGTFDALTTTNESLASAQLWESGVRYAFEDHQFLGEYIPLVSNAFWKKLAPEEQKLMLDLWARNIPAYRQTMAKAQAEARQTMIAHGIKFVDPTPGEIAAVRQKMMAEQDSIARELKLTPELVKQATAEPRQAIEVPRATGERRPMEIWNRLEQWLAGLLGAAALAVGIYQILGRYIDPELNVGWADEVVVYLTVWAVLVASSQLVRRDGHVRPDIVLRLLPPAAQRWVEIGNCVVALAFCGGLAWYGAAIVAQAYALDERSVTGLEFPMWIYYAALPTGGALMLLRYAIRLYRYACRFDPATMTVAAAHERRAGDAARRG